MTPLDEDAIERLEREHPEGLTAQDVVALLSETEARFSEATFRKYVQLGLLPRSRRVRRRGLRGGSQGLYPTSVIRRILEIKRLLAEAHTMDEIRQKFFCATSEIDELEESFSRVFARLDRAIEQIENTGEKVGSLRKDLKSAMSDVENSITKLHEIEGRLESRAQQKIRHIRVV